MRYERSHLNMKLAIESQWHEHTYIYARLQQLKRAAKLAGAKSFRDYAGVPTALSETQAITEWLESYEGRRDQTAMGGIA